MEFTVSGKRIGHKCLLYSFLVHNEWIDQFHKSHERYFEKQWIDSKLFLTLFFNLPVSLCANNETLRRVVIFILGGPALSWYLTYTGVELSFCVRRLGPFSKCVLRPEVIIFGVLRPATFWRLRPRPNFNGVLRLTVFWHLASGVWSQNSGVWRPGFTKNNRVSYSSASASRVLGHLFLASCVLQDP